MKLKPTPSPDLYALMAAGRMTLTPEEAGAVLGIGRSIAYRAVRNNEIPSIRIGKRVVVPIPALLKFLGAEPEQESEQ